MPEHTEYAVRTPFLLALAAVAVVVIVWSTVELGTRSGGLRRFARTVGGVLPGSAERLDVAPLACRR